MNIKYTLKRSRKRRKTISLNISETNEVIVSAPYFTPVREINNFVQEKQEWIKETIQKQSRTHVLKKEKEFVSGEYFYHMGESYPLEVFSEPNEKAGLLFWNKRFYLNASDDKEPKKKLFVVWYKQKALEYISERVDFFCQQFNIKARGVRISSAKQRWGSCSPDDKLAFSFRLMMMPPEIIDYVIVHELMHIKEKNHSPRFWKLVENVMPEYKNYRIRLKKYGEKFTF